MSGGTGASFSQKHFNWHFYLALAFCLGLAGCATTSADSSPRFHGTDHVAVVFQYNSEDYIYMTKPDYRDGAYLRQMHFSEVGGLLHDLKVPRGVAVVSLPWRMVASVEDGLLHDWKTLLEHSGYSRVIFVRGTGGISVEGAVIVSSYDLHPALAAQ